MAARKKTSARTNNSRKERRTSGSEANSTTGRRGKKKRTSNRFQFGKKSAAKKSGTKKSSSNRTRKPVAGRTRKSPSNDPRQRLQRIMASAGIASRRECETIIEEGRVEVDGQVVTQPGTKVDPATQEILVDAQKLVFKTPQYFILNKPPGVLSTSKDPSGRPRVIDLIKTNQRVYNVGRLDKASEGLILVTNDGDLANRLTHPRYGVEKKYHVQVAGIPAPRDLRKLEQGVRLAEGIAKATRVKFLKKAKNGCWLEMVLAEGRNREIRRMLAILGHKVRTLKRVAIGVLKMGDLPLGAHRPLTKQEIRLLQESTSGQSIRGSSKLAQNKKSRKKPASVGTEIRLSRQRQKKKSSPKTRKR
ncbi:MAG: pseudouridine synthase [Planctomycetota bacterium]